MADLIDRIARYTGQAENIDKINLHRWLGVQRLYALTEWTRQQIADEFRITGNPDQVRQATQIADVIDSFTGNNAALNKVIYIGRVEAVLMCAQEHTDHLYHNIDGTLNRTKIFEDLQIVG